MAKSITINPTNTYPVAIYREQYIAITQCHEEALILNQIIFWSNVNKGEWFSKSAQRLSAELMTGWSPSKILGHLKSLEEQGYIASRNNLFAWNRTKQYQLIKDNINTALEVKGYVCAFLNGENAFSQAENEYNKDYSLDNKQTVTAPAMPTPSEKPEPEKKPESVVCQFLNETETASKSEAIPESITPPKPTPRKKKVTKKGKSCKPTFNHPVMNQLSPKQRQSCDSICREIYEAKGEDALRWYVNFSINQDKKNRAKGKKPVKNFGGYIRHLYNADAHQAHLNYLEGIRSVEEEEAKAKRHAEDLKAATPVLKSIQKEVKQNQAEERAFKEELIETVDKQALDEFVLSRCNVFMKGMMRRGKKLIPRLSFINEFLESIGEGLPAQVV